MNEAETGTEVVRLVKSRKVVSIYIENEDAAFRISGIFYSIRNLQYIQGVQEIVLRLCGCYGGVVDLIILLFTELRRSGFNLEFGTFY